MAFDIQFKLIYQGIRDVFRVRSLSFEFQIPKDDPVRLLRHFVDEMDLSALYQTFSQINKNRVQPRQMFAILIYAYLNGIYSSLKQNNAKNEAIGDRLFLVLFFMP